VLAAVVVSAKGSKVVPLKRAADEFPKPGRFKEPVIIKVSLAGTRLEDACFLLSDRTWRLRMVELLPKPALAEFQFAPSNFMRKVEPFVAVPATQSCDASLFAAARAVTGPGMTVAPTPAVQF